MKVVLQARTRELLSNGEVTTRLSALEQTINNKVEREVLKWNESKRVFVLDLEGEDERPGEMRGEEFSPSRPPAEG